MQGFYIGGIIKLPKFEGVGLDLMITDAGNVSGLTPPMIIVISSGRQG